MLGSDHAPHTLRGEGQDLSADAVRHDRRADARSGHARSRQCRPPFAHARFVDLTSAGPARLFGTARKGRIAVGFDADLAVVDLKRRETITDRWVASRAGWTPYDGLSVTGWPVGTFVRGRRVMWQGQVSAPRPRRGGAIPRNPRRLVDLPSRLRRPFCVSPKRGFCTYPQAMVAKAAALLQITPRLFHGTVLAKRRFSYGSAAFLHARS